MTADQPMRLEIEGAAEHNLRDVDVAFGDGLTAVVGVSGSGKSSLVEDVVYHEARRRLLASLSLASPLSRMLPARVRRIRGLTPAVALGQDSVIRNPNSTVATATGIHPFLRVIYARFATRTCPHCDQPVDVVSSEQRLARVRTLVAEHGNATLLTPLVIGAHGTHERLLSLLVERFGRSAIEVDGGAWKGRKLDPDAPHDIALRGPSLTTRDGVAVRHALADIDDLGTTAVLVRGEGFEQRLASAPVCPFCGQHLHELAPTDFRDDRPDARGCRLGSLTLPALLALSVGDAAALVDALDLAPGAKRALREVALRLDALERVGLDYLTLDRPSPTLSRGEAQRLRLSVVLRNRIENVIHILDEPTIGLDPDQVGRTLDQLARLRGPVLMVEHDRTAVALADDVVEIGPGAGRAGGQIVFQGTPGALWQSETQSGMAFRATPGATERRRKGQVEEAITVRGASLRNLRGFDCRFPIGELTVVTGPSGAG